MKRFFQICSPVLILLFAAVAACAQQAMLVPDKRAVPEQRARGGIATMYALDPLSRALCFRDGGEGLAFQNHRWANRCSDLSFNLTADGSFVTGIESSRVAAIVDWNSRRSA